MQLARSSYESDLFSWSRRVRLPDNVSRAILSLRSRHEKNDCKPLCLGSDVLCVLHAATRRVNSVQRRWSLPGINEAAHAARLVESRRGARSVSVDDGVHQRILRFIDRACDDMDPATGTGTMADSYVWIVGISARSRRWHLPYRREKQPHQPHRLHGNSPSWSGLNRRDMRLAT